MSISWHPLLAVSSAAVLAGAVAWAVLEEASVAASPRPGYKGAPFTELTAAMPPIREFESFNVNELNPFVPWREREAEAKKINQPKIVAPVRINPPPVVKPVDPPVFSPPRRSEGGGDAPRILGIHGRNAGIIVQLRPGGEHRTMAIGQTIDGWTLDGIELGNICHFSDRLGRKYAFVIGGEPAAPAAKEATETSAGQAASPKPAPADQPAAPAKKPTPGPGGSGKPPFRPRGR